MRDSLIYVDVQQGTPEWMQARAGVITASEFDKILTPKTMKPSSQVDDYVAKLAAEWYMGHPADTYQSAWMGWGLAYEDEARKFYEMRRDIRTFRPGFIFMDEERLVGCSPDSMGLEIKCPSPATQVRYLLDGGLPAEYICQVQGLMYVTGAETWDFLSYHPELPEHLFTVERDPKWHEAFEDALAVALVKLRDARAALEYLRSGE